MNSMIGKSTGIALLMAAALLAALFAMGVFSATGVSAQAVGTTPGTLASLTIATSTEPIGGADSFDATPSGIDLTTADDTAYTATLIAGTPDTDPAVPAVVDWNGEIPKGQSTLVITPTLTSAPGTELEVQWNNQSATFADANVAGTRNDEATTVAIDLTDLANGVVGEVKIVVSDANPADNNVEATNFATHTYTISLGHVSASNSTTAGAAARLALNVMVTAATGDAITVNLKSFGLPSSFNADHVTIRSGASGSETQYKASDVTRSGDTLEVTIPDMNGDTQGLLGLSVANLTTISISSRAGITNPTVAGLYGITINDDDASGGDDSVDGLNVVNVDRSVSIDPKKGSSTADVTVTGKGFSSGSATVFIDKTPAEAATDTTLAVEESYDPNGEYDENVDVVIASGATITDGAFTATIAGISKPADVGKVTISAFDGANNMAEKTAEYTFSSGLSVSPESISWGQTLTLKMTDNSATPTEVRFGGNNNYKAPVLTSPAATAKEAKVQVPPGVPVGNQNVEVISSSGVVSGLSTTVEIVPLTLSISPTDPVPGEQVTIRGSGFENSKQITAVTFGSLDEVALSDTSVTSTSSGRVSFTYKVPLDIGTGAKKVTLGVGDRIGSGSITVAKPSVSVSPVESLIGSTITVTGSGFASSNRVEVFYDDEIEAVGVADSNGVVSINLTVPATAGIGATNPVEIRVRAQDTIKASADHKTPGAMITVSEQAQAGGMLTISGSNFQSFSILSEVLVGGQNVLPSPAPETDRQGTFSFQVRVPLLSIGSHTVSVKDGDDNSATETFSVVAETVVVSTAPADVFADLIEAGRLERVWYLIGATQMWEFYDPDPELASFNNLDEITVGEAYIVIVSEGDPIEFQGRTLYAGSNNIPIR